MTTKKTLIVANWKEHNNVHQASILLHQLNSAIKIHRNVEVVLAPSLLALQPLSVELDHRKFKLAAQNAYYKDDGAFTGEVSFTMLRDLVDYAIIGHSERRIYFNETLEVVREKVAAAIRNGIKPIVCVGETSHERAAGESSRVVHDMVTTALAHLTPEDIENVTIAYEPVWAISTFGGEIAKPDDMQRILRQIRSEISELYGAVAAEHVRILYGGSVKPETVAAYLSLPDCDGALVGGASLVAQQFAAIVDKAAQQVHVNLGQKSND